MRSDRTTTSRGIVVAGVLLVAGLVASACTLPLPLPAGARVLCATNDDCPGDLLCAVQAGLCVAPEGACVVGDVVVDDGTPCARTDGTQGICLAGQCAESVCGDGFVDLAAREECDDGEQNSAVATADRCRSDCRLPRCGDGVVDAAEACDAAYDPAAESSCSQCVATCAFFTGDCNGDSEDGCECRPTLVGVLPHDEATSPAVVAGGDFLYWHVVTSERTVIVREPIDGGQETEVLAENVGDFPVVGADDVGAYYFSEDGSVWRIRHGEKTAELFLAGARGSRFLFEPGFVYVLGLDVIRVDVDGTRASVVMETGGEYYGPALRGDFLVWATEAGEIFETPKDAPGEPVVRTVQPGVSGFAADADHVYFVKEGTLFRLTPETGVIDTLTRVDASSQYLEVINGISVIGRSVVVSGGVMQARDFQAVTGLIAVPIDGGPLRTLLETYTYGDIVVLRDNQACAIAVGDTPEFGTIYSLACVPL